MIIYSLITARLGSKGIKDKNIIDYNGYPLIYWSIKISKDCDYIKKLLLVLIQKIMLLFLKNMEPEVPFLRPKEISDDLSTDYEVFEHFIQFLKENNYTMPDAILHKTNLS